MRIFLAALWLASSLATAALAGGTTSTSTSSSSTVSTAATTSTSTTSSSSTSSSSTTTTLACLTSDDPDTPVPFGQCDPAATTKEECNACCGTCSEEALEACDDGTCTGDFDTFLDGWRAAGVYARQTCQGSQEPEGEDDSIAAANGRRFQQFNVDDSCLAFVQGCSEQARKTVLQCTNVQRCVACCNTVLRRWRRDLAETLRAGAGRTCNAAIRCVRKVTRRTEACRLRCGRKPTCGAQRVHDCLGGLPRGRNVLECYSKCNEKCGNADSYRWCLQACQATEDCAPVETCFPFFFGATSPAGCLERNDFTCVAITTTSSSTATSTSSSTTSSTLQ